MPEGNARASDEHERAERHRVERANSPVEHSAADQGEFLASRPAPTYPGKLLGDPRLRGRGNAPAQVDLLQQMQQTYGNRATQRLLQRQRASSSITSHPTTGVGPLVSADPVQREVDLEEAPAPAPPAVAQASEWIVDDSVENLLPGQMTKSAFIAQVRGAVKAAVGQTMSGDAGASQAGPQIDDILRAYSLRDSRSIEQEIRKTIPGAASATGASSYIHLIAGQVRRSVAQQASAPGAGGLLSRVMQAAGNLAGGIGKLLFKARGSGAKEDAGPAAINSQLGPGQPLDGAVGAGMESAFGQSFSGVRVHTDTEAAGLSDHLNARAFTVGQNIAFGTGEYRPGTPIGDALIAHELAHVVQQAGAPLGGLQAKDGDETSSLEEDADTAAVRAVLGMRGGLLGGLVRSSQEAMPHLRSGLRLQRCGKGSDAVSADVEKIASMIGMPDENADAIVAMLSQSSPTLVVDALLDDRNKSLIDKTHLRALAGTEGGRRVLDAMFEVFNKSPKGTGQAQMITEILDQYKAQTKNPREPETDNDKHDLAEINKVLKGDGEYVGTNVDYLGKSINIVPLRFPVTMLPSVPQMGGLYFSSDSSEAKGSHAARTQAENWKAGGKVQIPLVYIVFNPRALYEMDNRNENIDRTKPRSASYLESTLYHEFQHYKQFLARRGGEADSLELESADRDADREIEAFSIHIAHEATNSSISDEDLKRYILTMAGYMADAGGSFGVQAEDRIVDTLKDEPEAMKRLVRLIDAATAEEPERIKALLAARDDGKTKLSEEPREVMHKLAPLRKKLAAVAQLPEPTPKKEKKGKSRRKGKK